MIYSTSTVDKEKCKFCLHMATTLWTDYIVVMEHEEVMDLYQKIIEYLEVYNADDS